MVPSVFEWKDDFTPRKQPRVRLPLPSKTSLESNIDQADEVGECEDHTIQPNTELLNENQQVFLYVLIRIHIFGVGGSINKNLILVVVNRLIVNIDYYLYYIIYI